MYTPRGAGVSELGDIEVIADGDDLHLFHLTLPNHDVIQHAVSCDGLTWRPLPAALRTGDPGACDDDQIWTMSVTRRLEPNPGYVMLYTALSSADEGRVQRVAMATSDDLLHWTKSPANPVAAADPRWYESTPDGVRAVSFRDPKPVRIGDAYYATVCARENAGPLPRRGCAALIRSGDLETWEVLPPLFAPRHYWDLECPQLFRLGAESSPAAGPWYLTAAIMEDRGQRYWIADEPAGPFRIPPGGDILAPAGHYAARVTRWRGMDLLFAWHQPGLAKGWQSTPATVDWFTIRNPFGKFLAPPLLISCRGDSSLALGSFPGWHDRRGTWSSVFPDRGANAALKAAAASGMATASARLVTRDYILEGALVLHGARGGLALRVDDDESGLYIELMAESRTVSLQRWGIRRDLDGTVAGPVFEVLQSAQRHSATRSGHAIDVRVVNVGPYLEVSLDDEAVIAYMTGTRASDRCEIWVEDGECILQDARVAPLNVPGEAEPSGHRT